MTVTPPSITVCPGQTVLTFNCTVNADVVRWNVFTPVGNYTNLRVPVVDGDVVTSEVTRTLNPLEVVSSLTINVTAELNGSEVQCLTVINGRLIMDSGFIHIAGNVSIEGKCETMTNVHRSNTFPTDYNYNSSSSRSH